MLAFTDSIEAAQNRVTDAVDQWALWANGAEAMKDFYNILAYVIPKNDANNKMTLKFNDEVSYVKGEIGAKNIFVNLKPTDLRKKAETIENKIGETQNYEDSVLGNTFLEIDKYEISDKFRVDYKYCYATNKCIDSYEYLTPTPTGNYYKVLMKVSGKFSIDSNINSNNHFNNFCFNCLICS